MLTYQSKQPLIFVVVVRNAAVLVLLPVLLPEPAVISVSKGRKCKLWKPSISESMSYFVDVQKVHDMPCLHRMK